MKYHLVLCFRYTLTRQVSWVHGVGIFRLLRSGLEHAPCVACIDGVRGSDHPTLMTRSEMYDDRSFLASYLRRECIFIRQVFDTGESIHIPNNEPAAVRRDVNGTVKPVPGPHQIWAARPP